MKSKHLGKIMHFTALILACICLLFVSTMPLKKALAVDATKSQGQLMDWTLLDDTGGTMYLETNVLDSGEGYDAAIVSELYVIMANCNTSAGGDEAGFIVLVRTAATDESWREFVRFTATGGTANAGDCDAESAAAQANVYLTSTTNFETPGDIFFLHDAGTMANSTLVVFSGSYSNDDYITCIDNLVNTYDADDYLYDVVDMWTIVLPKGCDEAKVLFYNTDADCNYACRVDYGLMTAIE